MITTAQCVIVTCDVCKMPAEGDGGYVAHFDDLADARDVLDDEWTIGDDGKAECPTCIDQRACAEQGHEWGDWRDCRCRGRIPEHAENGCDQHRSCSRCCKPEARLTPVGAA